MTNSKTMRECLVQMVNAFGDGQIKHAMFTTFNFDPGFFEKNVLPLLCGLSLDDVQSMSNEALAREMYHPLKNLQVVVAYDQAVLQGFQGRFRYSLLPRHQKDGFFHAKIIVLTGVDAKQNPMATLMVSSGNMTLSGWGSNIEVAAWTPVNQLTAQELLGFYKYLDDPELNGSAITLQQIQFNESSPELFLNYPSDPDRGSLFERMFKPRLAGNMHILSPYWGKKAIQSFQSRGAVHCYPAKDQCGHQFCMTPADAKELKILVRAIKGEESFRHAKVYYWNRYMAIGSANCTSQALHNQNNVEAMLLFADQPQPSILTCSEPLIEWPESSAEKGPEPIPVGVLIIADYAKRCYLVSIDVSDSGRCATWQLLIGDIPPISSSKLESEIPFGKAKTIAQVYRIDWQGNAGSKSLMGMIIPKNGSDVELGYRPKRNLDQILQDMLRHKVSIGGAGGGHTLQPNTDDDPDGDEAELAPEAEDYDFDMYGMYQSFYHMRKDLIKAKTVVELQWMHDEISDTLQEIMLAIQNGEVKNSVQQWLIFQEAMDLTKQLPDSSKFDKFDSYIGLQTVLNQQLLNTLKSDSMQSYKIAPKALLNWTRKELGYER